MPQRVDRTHAIACGARASAGGGPWRGALAGRPPPDGEPLREVVPLPVVRASVNRRRVLVASAARNFAYGLVSVEIGLVWRARGLSPATVGSLFALTLLAGGGSSALAGLWAHRIGRRQLLVFLGAAMAAGGVVLALTVRPVWLCLAAAAGSFSPTGKDVGGMLPIDQAVLAQTVRGERRTEAYAHYNLLASAAGAAGSLAAGGIPLLARWGLGPAAAERAALLVYAALGAAVAATYAGLTSEAEVPRQIIRTTPARSGLHRSRGIVLRLTALFGVDALAGGLVVQGIVAVWLHDRFGAGLAFLGPLFFLTNLAAAASFLAAAPLARRFGLLNTMVFTHLPSNVLLLLVAFAPSLPLAAGLLVARSLLSQLDVPTRQAYTMELVRPEERAAAAGVTASVRGLASAVSPSIAGWAMARAAAGLPFLLAGTLKAGYDLALYAVFRRVPRPEIRP